MKLEKCFFPGSPISEITEALANICVKTPQIRKFIKDSLVSYDLIIGQGNRPDRIHSNLVHWKILPKFDIYFSGSKTGEENLAKKWIEREVLDGRNTQTPYIWDSPIMWENFFKILDQNPNKKILVSSSAPRSQHAKILKYPNVLFAGPMPDAANYYGGDKREMYEIYKSIGLKYDVVNYESSDQVVENYSFHASRLNSNSLVVQATKGSGGVTENDKQALFFVDNENQFLNAVSSLLGEGPLRVMKKFEGIPSNTSALTLPNGVYISGVPSVKPCGVKDAGSRMGASAGNQWDMRFPKGAIDSQNEQLKKVGEKMATTGYYGVFGLDPVISLVSDVVFNSEINARAQGPDSQRAYAAFKIGIPTLEEMQIAFYLGCPPELFPNPEEYNFITRWLKIPPYIKVFAKEDFFAKKYLSGYWKWENNEFVMSYEENADFKISGAPNTGQRVSKDSPDNFLYIKFLNVDEKIYTENRHPVLTDKALSIINYVYENIQ